MFLSQDDQFEDVEGVEILASQLEAARKRFCLYLLFST